MNRSCLVLVSLFLGQDRQGVAGAWVHLNVASLDALDALHEEYRARGARVVEPPTDCPWGLREMLVEDLDGNTLRVGAPLADEDAG